MIATMKFDIVDGGAAVFSQSGAGGMIGALAIATLMKLAVFVGAAPPVDQSLSSANEVIGALGSLIIAETTLERRGLGAAEGSANLSGDIKEKDGIDFHGDGRVWLVGNCGDYGREEVRIYA